MPPRLRLGPILRHVGSTDATVWVETDQPCTVRILDGCTRTFRVAGHHYALVHVQGLQPGARHEYTVELDGEVAWPRPDSAFPPCAIRTQSPLGPVRLLFGSCRVAYPHAPPYTLHRSQHEAGRGVDALTALADHFRELPSEELPDLVLHLGDQVYSDELSPGVREYVRRRRRPGAAPPGQVVDFEEYTRLYLESWAEPTLRWLLSTVPNAMIFDDHEVHDDWNTSLAWRTRMQEQPWWRERMIAALMTYWLYQHCGNLSPEALAAEGVLQRLQECEGDAAPLLREFAEFAHDHAVGTRWSYRRDLGPARLLVLDSRAGRLLEPGRRDMLDAEEWAWVEANLAEPVEHAIVASTLPVFLPPGLHDLEAWNERVAGGAWGRRLIPFGEGVRQALDLEHWAAFERSFARLARLLTGIAAGGLGWTPSTVTCLGGDVHFGYLAPVTDADGRAHAPIHQVVCSPLRNHLVGHQRRAVELSLGPAARAVSWLLGRSAGIDRPPVRWRLAQGPWFENHLGDLRLDGKRARLAIREAVPGRHPELRTRLLVNLDAS